MENKKMKSIPVVAAMLIAAGLPLGTSDLYAQTLEKIASSNKITVSYREAAVPLAICWRHTRQSDFRSI